MQRRSKLRVIIDTNCWISFLIGRRLSKLVNLLSNERIQLIICDELLAEIQEVTTRPKFAKYLQLAIYHHKTNHIVQIHNQKLNDYYYENPERFRKKVFIPIIIIETIVLIAFYIVFLK